MAKKKQLPILVNIEQLARRLNGCSGKMQYGYLPKGVKALVDEIVDEIGQTGDTAKLYDLWYQAKCSVYATYSDIPPDKLPLSREKELKAIRNELVYEAAKLGEVFKMVDSSMLQGMSADPFLDKRTNEKKQTKQKKTALATNKEFLTPQIVLPHILPACSMTAPRSLISRKMT